LEIHYEGAPAVSADEDAVDDDEPVEDEDDSYYKFGAWYPALQPYFPDLVRAMEVPERPARTGQFLFRVSLGKIWRRIAAPAETTLEELADAILDSVDFDRDHLYEFRLRDELGREQTIGDPRADFAELAAHEVDLAYLPLNPGQSMTFLFDFGNNWKFTVKLEAIEEAKTGGKGKRKGPRVLERHGKAPQQYPDWDG
jgi:hypothetical protein